jgi:hypothetical protein
MKNAVTKPPGDVVVLPDPPRVISLLTRDESGRTLYELTAGSEAEPEEVRRALRRIPTGAGLETVTAIDLNGSDALRLVYAKS